MTKVQANSSIDSKNKWKRLPKWARGLIVFFATLVVLDALVYTIANVYISTHKQELLSKINEAVHKEMDGNFEVKDIDVAFWQTFPNLSVRLSDITVSDTMYYKYKKNLLELKELFVTVDPVSLLKLKPSLGRITLKGGNVYMFKAEHDYTNTYILNGKPKPENEKKSGNALSELKFKLIDVSYVFEDKKRDKKIDIYTNRLKGELNIEGEDFLIHAKLNVKVNMLGFNLEQGAFLQNANVHSDLHLTFHKAIQQIEVKDQTIKVNDTKLDVTAHFNLARPDPTYDLYIDSKKTDYQKVSKFLSEYLQEKLSIVKIENPMHVNASIVGHLLGPDTPSVELKFSAESADVTFEIASLKKSKFSGRFTNQYIPGAGYGNDNIIIIVNEMQTLLDGEIPIHLDSTSVLDFYEPILFANIVSEIPVESIDAFTGKSVNLTKGTADVKVTYFGPLYLSDTAARQINGTIQIKDAAMTYVPRGLDFDHFEATLDFVGTDLFLKNVKLNSKESSLLIEGKAVNYLSAYLDDHKKATFNFDLTSKSVNLDEFKSLLVDRKPTPTTAAAETKPVNKKHKKKVVMQYDDINKRIENVLSQSDMHFNVRVDKVHYKSFDATNISAKINLLSDSLSVQDVHVNHANGSIDLNASVSQNNPTHPFQLNAKIRDVNISDLFKGFDNFGMKALKSENITGIFSAGVNITGNITNNINLKANSLNGNVDFSLKNGGLKNFKPFLEIQKYVFKKRHLENLTIDPLTHNLLLKEGKVYITPMEIITSAIYMKFQGVYAIKEGTDLFLEVPLRNPSKDAALIAKGKSPKRNSGMVIFLRAQDDANGDVRIAWDPQKNGLVEMEHVLAAEEKADASH